MFMLSQKVNHFGIWVVSINLKIVKVQENRQPRILKVVDANLRDPPVIKD